MCGIAGFVTTSPMSQTRQRAIAASMADALSHRGPDDAGIWTDPQHRVALAHRRLAILDLSPAGHQPMTSPDGRFVLVFNGEVYNFQALRDELSQETRYPFRGRSDTEVVLAAMATWGVERALSRFSGMFALALWDNARSTLYLARDRLGIKPLYYALDQHALIFGSELKALRAHPLFDAQLDRNALALYFRYGYVPSPYAIYARTHKLEPGKLLVLRCDRVPDDVFPEPEVRTWWSLLDTWRYGVANPLSSSDEDTLWTLDTLLRRAVRERMVSDVPLGAFLSGGIDSSTVVALMQAQSSRPIKTFCIGFADPDYDEADAARSVAGHLGTDHTTVYVGPGEALEVVPRIPEFWDEPFGDSSQIPTYLVAALTRRHVTVSLSGDGGDELFAGYNRYRLANQWRYLAHVPRGVREWAGRVTRGRSRRLIKATGGVGARVLWRLEALAIEDYRSLYRYFLSHHKYPETLVKGGHELTTWLSGGPPPSELGDRIQQATFWDLVTYLPDDILTKVDRATMAVSLEARVPLLDHRVVAFAARIPTRQKVRHGRYKWILRELLSHYVPRDIVDRPKKGFSVPLTRWLQTDLREWAETLLDASNLRATGVLNVRAVRRLWKDFHRGRTARTNLLWTILMFLAWADRWA